MIDSLHNNSNRIGVRINNMNNLNYFGNSKIDEHGNLFTWKTVIESDYVVDGGTSTLVSAGRANGSPFGGPLLEGESRIVSYSLDEGETWTVLNNNENVNIANTGLTVQATMSNNTSLMNINFDGNPDLVGTVEIVFKAEMQYTSPATPHENYKGPEYFDFILRGKQELVGFVDPTNNVLFDGHKPYIFWMPGQGQSVGMNYSTTIWAVGSSETVTVSMEPNNVFHLLDNDLLADPEPDTFDTIQNLFTDEVTVVGSRLNGSYVYPIYIYGMTMTPGQFTHPIVIDGEEYLIGIDAYMENEPLYINLSNMGVELPDSIQKALYTSNVHEEKKDNILINRKLKELISQYWDVLAGRGSYKSLINSLNWFEWGDLVALREIWARDSVMKTKYFVDEELSSLLTKEYKDLLTVFKKTTYLAIYHALQKIMVVDGGIVYDPNQQVPVLEPVVSRWSKEDLSLKLAMLGAFYETFFMPIHLELLHCTITDIVYTDSFRNVFGANQGRLDHAYQSSELKCDVEDGAEYVLHNCTTQTNWNTMFAWDWEREYRGMNGLEDEWSLRGTDQYTMKVLGDSIIKKQTRAYETAVVVGCETFEYNQHDLQPDNTNPYAASQDNYQKNFWVQKFGGVGVVIPFRMIANFPEGHTVSLHRERLYVLELDDNGNVLSTTYRESHVAVNSYHWHLDDEEYTPVERLEFTFNLLFTRDARWQLRFEFDTVEGESFTKILNIKTLDLSNATIDVMKVKPSTYGTNYDNDVTDYMMRIQPFANLGPVDPDTQEPTWIPQHYSVFLPCTSTKDNPDENCSIRRNNILVFSVSNYNQTRNITNYFSDDYDIYYKYELDASYNIGQYKYVVCVSKVFDFNPDSMLESFFESHPSYRSLLYRNDYGFIGQNHHMEMVGERLPDRTGRPQRTDVLEDYLIYSNEVISIVPNIRWGHAIDQGSIEWEFRNASLNKTYNIKSWTGDNISAQTPFVAAKERLAPGFYDIIFKYRLKSDPTPRVLMRNSAFKLLGVPRTEPEPTPEPDSDSNPNPSDDTGGFR